MYMFITSPAMSWFKINLLKLQIHTFISVNTNLKYISVYNYTRVLQSHNNSIAF